MAYFKIFLFVVISCVFSFATTQAQTKLDDVSPEPSTAAEDSETIPVGAALEELRSLLQNRISQKSKILKTYQKACIECWAQRADQMNRQKLWHSVVQKSNIRSGYRQNAEYDYQKKVRDFEYFEYWERRFGHIKAAADLENQSYFSPWLVYAAIAIADPAYSRDTSTTDELRTFNYILDPWENSYNHFKYQADVWWEKMGFVKTAMLYQRELREVTRTATEDVSPNEISRIIENGNRSDPESGSRQIVVQSGYGRVRYTWIQTEEVAVLKVSNAEFLRVVMAEWLEKKDRVEALYDERVECP